MKIHVESQRVMEELNNHEGSPRVTREVNCHLICYIYTLIVQEKEFSPWILLLGIGEEDNCFGEPSDCANDPLLRVVVFTILMYLGTFT